MKLNRRQLRKILLQEAYNIIAEQEDKFEEDHFYPADQEEARAVVKKMNKEIKNSPSKKSEIEKKYGLQRKKDDEYTFLLKNDEGRVFVTI